MDMPSLARFCFELGQLRRVPHTGVTLAGVAEPQSVAEHSLRAAQIAYILAILEGHPAPERVCTMTVFHDLGETRIGDIHKVANRYVTADEARAVDEQCTPLGDVGDGIRALWHEREAHETDAAIISRDADLLEMAVSAKEYVEIGYTAAQDWIENVSRALKTDSAKSLLATLRETPSTSWWAGLKKIDPEQ